MPMYNLIEYNDNYLPTSGSCSHELCLDNIRNIADFTGANPNSKSFKYKQKITGQTDADEMLK